MIFIKFILARQYNNYFFLDLVFKLIIGLFLVSLSMHSLLHIKSLISKLIPRQFWWNHCLQTSHLIQSIKWVSSSSSSLNSTSGFPQTPQSSKSSGAIIVAVIVEVIVEVIVVVVAVVFVFCDTSDSSLKEWSLYSSLSSFLYLHFNLPKFMRKFNTHQC